MMDWLGLILKNPILIKTIHSKVILTEILTY
jgi:hypothetical protein